MSEYKRLKNYISLLKLDLSLGNNKIKDLNSKREKFIRQIFNKFNQECENQKAITYNDMMYLPAKFFEKDKASVTQASKFVFVHNY